MIIGRLDRLITYERKSVTINATGNETETYTTLFTGWSSIQPFRGKETTQAGEVVASNFYVIKTRYNSSLKPKDRANYNSNYYDIVSVNELGRKEGLELMVEWKDNTQ